MLQDIAVREDPLKVADPEIFDDSDFYHHILQEFIQHKNSYDPVVLTKWAAGLFNTIAILHNIMTDCFATDSVSQASQVSLLVFHVLINFIVMSQGVHKFNWTNFQEIPGAISRKIQDILHWFGMLCNVPNLLLWCRLAKYRTKTWYAFYTTWGRKKHKNFQEVQKIPDFQEGF